MDNGKANPLLAQLPLTVSPFIPLPRAVTLSYNFKALPSTLPPSSTGENQKAKYVISQSGHAAHPDEIITSCEALRTHLKKLQDDAEETLKKWQNDIRDRELAEKRALAPGWLDRDEKILQPVKKSQGKKVEQENLLDVQDSVGPDQKSLTQQRLDEGEEMDKAFGKLEMK